MKPTVLTAYYPEHWPRARWDVDARLMRDAGIGLVRMGEFAWSRLEPDAGCFDTAWLADAVGLFASHGIRSVLCTPTACYPAWLRTQFPDVSQRRRDDRIKHPGMRQDADKCHPG